MSQDAPNPKDFGLDNDTIRFFQTTINIEENLLPSVLGWFSFFVIVCLYHPEYFFKKDSFYWLILFLYFLPGFAIGYFINWLREVYHDAKRRRHRLYAHYQQYLAAYSAYDEIKRQQEKEKRVALHQKKLELKRTVEWWQTLSGRQFEKELANLLQSRGYQVKLTPKTSDGGVDLYIYKDSKIIVVQCKAHKKYISPGVVRELYGTMLHENADESWLVTTNGFYSGAHKFAKEKPIKLLTIRHLLEDTTLQV
ncbi:MAG: restriction endonuclease [Proteobacteria bacterium]|nr:restriction endonuclease [Pseudomonadota bacterium]